ncbi:MAG: DNA internalization-related competence protein ComEC/Rec2 [Anaerococcus sp.]|nr:DNA internalization-related competence protein ComEC/Rec2 [Anaerococcus sp.]
MRDKILTFLLGLLLGSYLFINYENLELIYLLPIVLVGIFLYMKKTRYYLLFLGLIISFLGSSFIFSSKILKNDQKRLMVFEVLEKRRVDESYRYILRAEDGKVSEKTLYFSKRDLDIGQRFKAKGDFSKPSTNTNPNLFSYRKYLASKNIFSQVKFDGKLKFYKSRKPSLVFRDWFYKYVHEIFDKNLSKLASDFANSLILGENLLDNQPIRDLGLAHILAISGLHLDLILGFLLFIFAKLNINYKISYLLSFLLSLAYGYLIGFPFSVLRVLGLNLFSYLSFRLKKPLDKIKALLIIASIIVLFNPFAILNSGFILSFVASFSVYLIYPYFKRKTFVKDSLAFTGSIQLGLMPFMIYYNGSINLLAILANFLILPIFTLTMGLIFSLLLGFWLIRPLAFLIFGLIDLLVEGIVSLAGVLGSFDFFNLYFKRPHILMVVYFFLSILILTNVLRTYAKKNANLIFISILILIFTLGNQKDKSYYQMIDIGQADSFLLADRGDYYLIDLGKEGFRSYDSGEKVLLPYLKSLGISKIKGIFISHEDSDHVGSLDLICKNFDVENIFTSPANKISTKGPRIRYLKEKDKIILNDGYIKVVYAGMGDDENEDSLGLLINIKEVKILTLGDLPKNIEDMLDVKADILKLSHHGSKTSSSKTFIDKVDPSIVLISAGKNNIYGHPHKEVLENLTGRRVYKTYEDGLVHMDFGKNFRIEGYNKGGYFR